MFKIIGNQLFFDGWRVADVNVNLSASVRDRFENALEKSCELNQYLKNRPAYMEENVSEEVPTPWK